MEENETIQVNISVKIDINKKDLNDVLEEIRCITQLSDIEFYLYGWGRVYECEAKAKVIE